jgi:UDP-2-acetamido-3-amino-2,3-dideoxy-glucuronate N-acetyltransferase
MSTLLVGCGYWGKNWAKTLHHLGELAAICDPRPDIQAALKSEYPGVAVYDDLQAALSGSNPPDSLPHQINQAAIETVVIATPVLTHDDMARQCLLAGKHVLVEKPLALSPTEAQALVALAERQERILAVGHLLLYQPALLHLKALMDAGALGDILGIECTRVNLGQIRNEENVWWSLAPHDLSILCMLTNEPWHVISAQKLNWLQRPGLEDAVHVILNSASGKQARVSVSWYSPVKRHETVVIGSRKIAIFEDTQPPEKKLQLLDYDLQSADAHVLSIQKGACAFLNYPQTDDDLLTRQAKAFLEMTRGQRESIPNSGYNGLQVVRLLAEAQALLEQSPQRFTPYSLVEK